MGAKVLVVDDDPIAGGLSRDLLAEGGCDATLLTESLKAMDWIKREHPALVVLDILMPGLDGLTLCHMITNEPSFKDIKVVIISGKAFQADKDRARKYGATMFIEKPYNVESFLSQIQEVLGRSEAPVTGKAVELETLSSTSAAVTVSIWGCRGVGEPGARPSRYGRKTSCVSVDTGEHVLIFDAGTGLIDLGQRLEQKPRKELWLFLTHFHADHTQGLPSFLPAARRDLKLHIAGAREPDITFEQHVADAFQSAPATIPGVDAEIELYEMQEDVYEPLAGVKITAFYANHPGATLGFCLETKGRKIVYCPDSELYGEYATALQDYDEKTGAVVRGADLLVHDGRYTPEDYKHNRNAGHSSFIAAVDFAGKNLVKHLVLVHQDDRYADGVLDQMAKDAQARVEERGYKLKVSLGREGLRLSV